MFRWLCNGYCAQFLRCVNENSRGEDPPLACAALSIGNYPGATASEGNLAGTPHGRHPLLLAIDDQCRWQGSIGPSAHRQ